MVQQEHPKKTHALGWWKGNITYVLPSGLPPSLPSIPVLHFGFPLYRLPSHKVVQQGHHRKTNRLVGWKPYVCPSINITPFPTLGSCSPSVGTHFPTLGFPKYPLPSYQGVQQGHSCNRLVGWKPYVLPFPYHNPSFPFLGPPSSSVLTLYLHGSLS